VTGTSVTGTTVTGMSVTGRTAVATRAATTGIRAPAARRGPAPGAQVRPGGRTARATRATAPGTDVTAGTVTTVARAMAPGTTATSAGTARRAGIPGPAASRDLARAGPPGRKRAETLADLPDVLGIPPAEVPQVRGGTQDRADISDISSQASGLRVGALFLAPTPTRAAGCGRLTLAVDGLCDRNSLPDSTKPVPLGAALVWRRENDDRLPGSVDGSHHG
jgi:hypothetical protein